MEATSGTVKQAGHPLVFSSETLRGDIRDVLLTHIRLMEAPWSKLSEQQQRDKIEAIDKAARTVVRGAVNLVAQQGFPSLDVRISNKGKYGDGGIEMACSAAFNSVNVTKIAEYGNGSAILVFAEPGEYFGERRAARPEPDQGAMDLDADVEGAGDDSPDGAEAGSDVSGGAREQPEATCEPVRTRRARKRIGELEPA